MQLGWVDYSRQERDTIKELLKMLGEASSLDELGVGIVRDSISDLLYPGTSVLHTRAKYYILIPALFQKAGESGLTTRTEIRRFIDSEQDKIARALRRVIDVNTGTKEAGIIGGRSDRAVKMKPTRIYWNGLRTTGILCNPGLSYDDACSAVASYNKKKQNIEIKSESEDESGDSSDASKGDFILFNTPYLQSIDDYCMDPTLYMTREESEYLREQFLHVPIMKNTLMEYCLKTKTSLKDTSFTEITTMDGMSELLGYHIELAKEFASFIYGAYLVYNIVFFENGGENATETEKEFLEEKYLHWKENTPGLPHREEILKLVRNHEHYKASLRDFLIQFEKAVQDNHTETCSEKERELIQARERFCKREKAKLGKNYPYQAIQTVPMSYRHGTGQMIIADILEGMGK